VAGYYFKKFVTTATRVSPPTSATKSAQSGHRNRLSHVRFGVRPCTQADICVRRQVRGHMPDIWKLYLRLCGNE
jgi:hypothetical protein